MDENIKEKAAEMRREYLRQWRKRNPEKMRQYHKTYWERKAALSELKESECSNDVGGV